MQAERNNTKYVPWKRFLKGKKGSVKSSDGKKITIPDYFGRYPVECNNEVQRTIWSILSSLLTIRRKKNNVLPFYNAEMKHQHFTKNIRHMFIKAVKGVGHVPINTGRCMRRWWPRRVCAAPSRSLGPSWTGRLSLPAKSASNLNFSHSSWRQKIRQVWRMRVAVFYS